MRMRIKQKEAYVFCCNVGASCSLSVAVWSLLGFMVVIHLHSIIQQRDKREIQLNLNRLSFTKELEQLEEEKFSLPPPRGKRSPRAVHRRGRRKSRTAIDEFLDESSELRSFFFPDTGKVLDPWMEGNDSMYYYPGRQWLDTDGNLIQAHGGCILYVKSTGRYYWYGENKNGPTYHANEKGTSRVDVIGVNCYSSTDLWAWQNEGIVLPGVEENPSHDLYKLNVLERPKVIYNHKTRQYVMWMHIDDSNYTKASVGVAVSDKPTGPFEYLYSTRPHGFESRDMTIFKDDGDDRKAYLIYSSDDNSELHVGPLTDDYLNLTTEVRRILIGQHREAPTLFKHESTYYMITSGCTGWAPNQALAHTAASIMGPWETLGNPCVGGNKMFRMTTFFAQSTFVLPLQGLPGCFIFMADRWNYEDLGDSRYVWLPLIVDGVLDEHLEYNFGFPSWSRLSIYWHRRWRLPVGWKAATT